MIALLTAAMERMLSHYIGLDPHSLLRLAEFEGKVAKIEISAWNLIFYLFPDQQGLRLQNFYEGSVDVSIKGSATTLLRAGLMPAAQVTTMAKDLVIEGDVKFAQELSLIFKQIQIDWEDILSRLTGDSIAHQVGNACRDLKQWGVNTLQSLNTQLVEYLQEEANYLPPAEAVEDFFADIQGLVNDVERLALGIARLQL